MVDVMEHLHLLTLSFTVDEELWRYNCMRLDVLWAFGYRSFREMEPWENFLMVKYCKELEHQWCAFKRLMYRGICRWLRSWLACIAELAGHSRLDENQFDLRTFGGLLISSLGDLYFKQLGIVLTNLRKVELESWNRVYREWCQEVQNWTKLNFTQGMWNHHEPSLFWFLVFLLCCCGAPCWVLLYLTPVWRLEWKDWDRWALKSRGLKQFVSDTREDKKWEAATAVGVRDSFV